MSPLRISKRPVKHLNSELKNLAKAKKKSEEQLSSLKRDHGRIQDGLKSSSESLAKSVDGTRTFSVLKNSNAQMTARWQRKLRFFLFISSSAQAE
eukprot:scaffold4500_cov326-Chaetoceros_neogracile.AAC.1